MRVFVCPFTTAPIFPPSLLRSGSTIYLYAVGTAPQPVGSVDVDGLTVDDVMVFPFTREKLTASLIPGNGWRAANRHTHRHSL